MSEDKLASKLKQHLAQTGQLSDGDVANFAAGKDPAEEAKRGEEMEKESTIPADDPGKQDILDKDSSKSTAADALQGHIHGMPNVDNLVEQAKAEITITPEDKEAFVQAMVTGERMQLTFSTCGGKVPIIIRNRTLPETRAIISQLRHEMDTKSIQTQLDYSVRLRAAVMTAQVQEVMGVAYPIMESCEPLQRTQTEDGIKDPGWLCHADRWATLPEALHAMIWNCVWEFETKYWAMIKAAKNQDFWSPEASTSE